MATCILAEYILESKAEHIPICDDNTSEKKPTSRMLLILNDLRRGSIAIGNSIALCGGLHE